MVVLGVPPVFQIVTHLPIFSGGHNGRLAILALLCLALLARLGPRRPPGAPAAQRDLGGRGDLRAADRLRRPARAHRAGRGRPWPEDRVGLCHAAGRRGDHPRGRRLGMGAARRRGRRADRPDRASPRPPRRARRARPARRLPRPGAGGHGLQPVDPARRRDAARHAGDPDRARGGPVRASSRPATSRRTRCR